MPALVIVGGAAVLLLLLFLLASPTFDRALRDTLSGIPILGGWLADNSQRLIVFMFGKLNAWAASALGGLTQLLNTLADLEYGFASQVQNLASAAHESVVHLRSVVIPAAILQAEAYGERRLVAVAAQLAAGVNLARAEVRTVWTGAVSYSSTLYVRATAYALHLAVLDRAYAGRLWVSATTYAGQLWVRSERDAQAREVRSERYTAAAVASAVDRADGEFRQAEDYAAQLSNLVGRYAERLTGQAVARADLQNAQTTAFAAAAVGAVALAISEVENSRCMQQCDTLGQIGEFASALDVGLLIGFVIEARAHPEAAVDFMRSQVAPFLKGLGSETGALIGG